MGSYRLRRTIAVIILLLLSAAPLSQTVWQLPTLNELTGAETVPVDVPESLRQIPVKGRAPKTGYERSEFGAGWGTVDGCSTRERILARDLTVATREDGCRVLSGKLDDPYTGTTMSFIRGPTTSDDIQIDHVVALSNAWQTGAQQLTYPIRVRFANDPLNLLAVSGAANEEKSDGDAATWLPPNKAFRCQYVKRQISVKAKYGLWVTEAEQQAMGRVLEGC